MPRILVVEDVAEMSELIALYLRKEGLEVRECRSAEEALEEFPRTSWDAIILDITLPGINGYEFLQSLRATSSVPVLILSARDSDEDMVLGLGLGADEYVSKPFSPRVLAARVLALVRRAQNEGAQPKMVQFGPYTFDQKGRRLRRDGVDVPLSSRELEILECLIRHEGEPVSVEQLYQEVWQQRYGDPGSVKLYILRLRRKIEVDPSQPVYVTTCFGIGYRFERQGTAQG